MLTFNATDEDHNVSYLILFMWWTARRFVIKIIQIYPTRIRMALSSSIHRCQGSTGSRFQQDGLDDILELNSTNLLRVFLNTGSNLFDPPISVSSSTITVSQILVNDLSGDGYPDVVALDSTNGRILGRGMVLIPRSFI